MLLQVDHVSLSFKGLKALDDISFGVAEREICAIIGPNGAGKSSLLNIVNGVYRPQLGAITFAGERRAQMQPHHAALRGISRTFQNIALFRGMTVLENVMVGRHLMGRASFVARALSLPSARAEERRARAAADRIIAFLHLEAQRDAVVGQLPYGLQKRVELGRALAAEPKLLLLDEPMAGMSFEEKEEMSAFIREVNRTLGTTILLIEHDMGIVMDLSDHLVVDYGRKIGDGPPAEVRDLPEVIAAYLGVSTGDEDVEAERSHAVLS
jgi:branched-chain amino acid transport system ATP-binding protein